MLTARHARRSSTPIPFVLLHGLRWPDRWFGLHISSSGQFDQLLSSPHQSQLAIMWSKPSLLAIALNLALTLAHPVAEHIRAEHLVAHAPASFQHPGVLVSKAQLDFITGKVNCGVQPWANAFTDMMNNTLASLSRQPKPTATVECGPTSTPNIGCTGTF